jgi:hypothetical protein
MTTITFDTHSFVKKLKAVGFTEEQAEVLLNINGQPNTTWSNSKTTYAGICGSWNTGSSSNWAV